MATPVEINRVENSFPSRKRYSRWVSLSTTIPISWFGMIVFRYAVGTYPCTNVFQFRIGLSWKEDEWHSISDHSSPCSNTCTPWLMQVTIPIPSLASDGCERIITCVFSAFFFPLSSTVIGAVSAFQTASSSVISIGTVQAFSV